MTNSFLYIATFFNETLCTNDVTGCVWERFYMSEANMQQVVLMFRYEQRKRATNGINSSTNEANGCSQQFDQINHDNGTFNTGLLSKAGLKRHICKVEEINSPRWGSSIYQPPRCKLLAIFQLWIYAKSSTGTIVNYWHYSLSSDPINHTSK